MNVPKHGRELPPASPIAQAPASASALRLPLTLLMVLLAPPLALVAWIGLSGGQRPLYLRSAWVRAGIIVLVAGALPLVCVGIAAAVGMWPDPNPNPNPIGLGLLFLASGALACVLALVGVLRVAAADRAGRR